VTVNLMEGMGGGKGNETGASRLMVEVAVRWGQTRAVHPKVPHLEIEAGHHMLSEYILLEKVMIQEIELLSKRVWC